MRRTFDNLTIEVTEGNLVFQPDMDAVVNAANAGLMPGGGVAGAIHAAAGPGLMKECRPLAPIRPGQAVITGGHELANDHVIHCLGPVYGVDVPSATLLADCYRNALAVADQSRLATVAFPSISTGIFGYPMKEAARIALRTVAATAPSATSVRVVRFVLFGRQAYEVHIAALAELE